MTAGSILARLKSRYSSQPPIVGVCEAASAFNIPFTQLMNMPPPFVLGAVDDFHTCHLPVVTESSFSTSDAWTGVYLTPGLSPYSFNAVGGPHRDGFEDPTHPAPPEQYPYGHSSESVVRFELVGEHDGTTFVLVSNNFHSKNSLHKLHMEVVRETGRPAIVHWHPLYGHYKSTGGAMTA